MNHPDPDTIDSDQLLGEVAAEYLDRVNRGERPSLGEYAKRYPSIADLIRRTLPALVALREVFESDAEREQAADSIPPPELAGFRIIRQLGRGGMGIVYEAEHEPMGRRVALKVLPFAALADSRVLARFKNEVRAAATLSHPHIVSAYSVGEEKGVHYYAMQLIRGQSLAEIILQLREQSATVTARHPVSHALSEVRPSTDQTSHLPTAAPGQTADGATAAPLEADTRPIAALSTAYSNDPQQYFRRVAEIGVQIAEALDHAHEQGIVHRDIKPANLLIDARGEAFVTDFGLARITSHVGVTMTGDVIGTLRYMAPEQALGKPALVDHRADIYGLGATLYELVALRPAFDGVDRETLLRQFTFDTPQLLRRINRQIPAELEAIIAQAMSKEVAERYSTAQEMADDLHRFLHHQPIRAHHPSLMQRFQRWGRRHQRLVAALLAILLLSTLGLATSTFLIARQRQEKDQALKAASENYQLAMEAVSQLTNVAEKDLIHRSEMEGVRYDLLNQSLKFYEHLADRAGDSVTSQLEVARAKMRLGKIYLSLGRRTDGYASLCQATDQLRALWRQHGDRETGMALADALLGRANATFQLQYEDQPPPETDFKGTTDEAIKLLQILDTPAASTRELKIKLADAHFMAARWERPQGEKAAHYDQARALLEQIMTAEPTTDEEKFKLALVVAEKTGDIGGPVSFKALDTLDQLVQRYPTNAVYRRELAHIRWSYALGFGPGHELEAVKWLRHAVELYQQLVTEYPSTPHYRADLAMAQMNLAIFYHGLKEFGQGLHLARQAEETMAHLQRDYQHHIDVGAQLVRARDALSMFHFENKDYRQLAETQLRIIEHEKMGAQGSRDQALFYWNVGWRYYRLANTLADVGEFDSVLAWANEGDAAWQRFREINPELSKSQYVDMANAYRGLCESLLRAGRWEPAQDLARKYVAHQKLVVQQDPPEAFALLDLARTCVGPGYEEFHDPSEGLRLLDEAWAAHEKQPTGAGLPAEVWRLRGLAHFRLGQWNEAIAALQKSIEARAGSDWPANAYEWLLLAMACAELGQQHEAEKWYELAKQWLTSTPTTAQAEKERRDLEYALSTLHKEAQQKLAIGTDPLD